MACERVNFGDGTAAIICSRNHAKHNCESCGKPGATIRCDYPVKRQGRSATCDRWQCAGCATEIAPNVHHCRPHAQLGPPKL